MAIPLLEILYIILLTILIIGIIVMFATKGKTAATTISLIFAVISLFLAFLSYKHAADLISPAYGIMFSLCLAALSFLGIITMFWVKNTTLAKCIFTISVLGGYWGCGAVEAILTLF